MGAELSVYPRWRWELAFHTIPTLASGSDGTHGLSGLGLLQFAPFLDTSRGLSTSWRAEFGIGWAFEKLVAGDNRTGRER